jgi:hypothetical protein
MGEWLGGDFQWRGVGNRVGARRRWQRPFDFPTLLKPVSIDQVWQEHQSGLRDRSTELWTLFMFGLWEQQCMSVKPADAIKKAGLR